MTKGKNMKPHDNELALWRAVLAFSLTDNYLSIEEQKILSHHFKSIHLSERQKRY